ncbi:MAG: hypothetical protein WC866_04410 [Patescibacteria group bacterium]|jgi:hypothetical protein
MIENETQRIDPRAILIGIAGGYLGLVLLAFWVDGKLYKRRLRKKRERSEFTPKDRAWFRKDDTDAPKDH